MQKYIIRRLLLIPPTVFLVLTIIFIIMHITPGDEVLARIEEGTNLRQETLDRIRADLGLDRPLIVQYGSYLWDLVRGDLGTSFFNGRPVVVEWRQAAPVTLELGLLTQLIALAIALPVGIMSALKQDTWIDYSLRVFTITNLAAPGFWVGTMVIVGGAIWFHWAPPLGYVPIWEDPITNLKQFLLPAAVFGLSASAFTGRITRSAMLEVLRQDYVRTAHAKGLAQRAVILRHVLKNAMIPVITVWGGSIAFLLGGSAIIEQIFALPGIGRSTLEAIEHNDTMQLQANIVFFALFLSFMNLIVDISYSLFDPRIRYS